MICGSPEAFAQPGATNAIPSDTLTPLEVALNVNPNLWGKDIESRMKDFVPSYGAIIVLDGPNVHGNLTPLELVRTVQQSAHGLRLNLGKTRVVRVATTPLMRQAAAARQSPRNSTKADLDSIEVVLPRSIELVTIPQFVLAGNLGAVPDTDHAIFCEVGDLLSATMPEEETVPGLASPVNVSRLAIYDDAVFTQAPTPPAISHPTLAEFGIAPLGVKVSFDTNGGNTASRYSDVVTDYLRRIKTQLDHVAATDATYLMFHTMLDSANVIVLLSGKLQESAAAGEGFANAFPHDNHSGLSFSKYQRRSVTTNSGQSAPDPLYDLTLTKVDTLFENLQSKQNSDAGFALEIDGVQCGALRSIAIATPVNTSESREHRFGRSRAETIRFTVRPGKPKKFYTWIESGMEVFSHESHVLTVVPQTTRGNSAASLILNEPAILELTLPSPGTSGAIMVRLSAVRTLDTSERTLPTAEVTDANSLRQWTATTFRFRIQGLGELTGESSVLATLTIKRRTRMPSTLSMLIPSSYSKQLEQLRTAPYATLEYLNALGDVLYKVDFKGLHLFPIADDTSEKHERIKASFYWDRASVNFSPMAYGH
jgi:hypothetical protein